MRLLSFTNNWPSWKTTARALSLAVLPLGSMLTAQEADTSGEVFVLDDFVVSGGFAGSLADAAVRKQNTPQVVEVLMAEDIGKLPDVSIADSLARLPGVSTQRVNGRAQIISVRGLNEDFTTATLNGREQVTTGSSRAIEFDQYPSELLSGAVLYKTGDASVVSQGLAGVVDLQTVKPLAYDGRMIAAGAYYEWLELDALNAGSSDDGYRLNFTYIDQFADDTFGLAVGVAHSDRPGQGEQWNAWGYPNVGADVDASTPNVIGGAKPFIRSSDLERTGVMATLQYRPSQTFETSLDIYYTDFAETQMLRGIELPLFWSGAQLQPGFTVEDGLITAGTFNNVFGVMRNDIVDRTADIYSLGWNVKLNDLAGWDVMFDLSYSFIDRTDIVLETYSGTGTNQSGAADSIAFRMEGSTGAVFTPSVDYTDRNLIVLTGPQGWGNDVVPGGQLGYLKKPASEDEITQARVTASREAPILRDVFKTIEFGANMTSRSKDDREDGFYLAGAGGATEIALPQNTGVSDLSFIGIPGQISYDPLATLASGVYTQIPNPNSDTLSQDWMVEEEITTLYAKALIDARIGDMPLTGSIGLQFIHADQSSTGSAAQGGGATLVRVDLEGSHDYWDVVPSLNLNLELTEGRILRFSVARQVARQRMESMRVGTQFDYNPALSSSTDVTESPWSGSGGNIELEPWRSNSFDLSLEQYFAKGMGYVALTGFYKDMRNYTRDVNLLTDFTGFPTAGGQEPALREGFVSKPANTQGGEIKGIEATLSIAGDLLSDALNGFGLILSGSLVSSDIKVDLTSDNSPMPGLSEEIFSGTLYYERGGFSSRLSLRYRSEYLADIRTFGTRGRDFRTVNAETVLDAQIGYTFQSGAFEGIGIVLQGYNLTNEPVSSYESGDPRLIRDYQEYGASYSLGVNYKF